MHPFELTLTISGSYGDAALAMQLILPIGLLLHLIPRHDMHIKFSTVNKNIELFWLVLYGVLDYITAIEHLAHI